MKVPQVYFLYFILLVEQTNYYLNPTLTEDYKLLIFSAIKSIFRENLVNYYPDNRDKVGSFLLLDTTSEYDSEKKGQTWHSTQNYTIPNKQHNNFIYIKLLIVYTII
jgi:hypothetical protein